MDAVELIELYSTLFYVFLGIAAFGLVLAVFFFFYFDIPAVRAMMTGKAKQETIRRMEEKNAMTGSLRFQYPGNSGDVSRGGNNRRSGRTGRTSQPGAPQVSQSNPSPAHSEPETSILQDTVNETVVLGGANAQPSDRQSGHTAILNRSDSSFRFEITQSTVVIHTDEII